MFWERKDAVQCLSVEWTVIGSIFPWAGNWAAALQGETLKTARTEDQARAYIEKHAETHFKKLCLADHKENGPEFTPTIRALNRADRAANNQKRKQLENLQF